MNPMDQLKQRAEHVAASLDADILMFNGMLRRPYDAEIIQACRTRRRRTNVFLMLTTSGGDPNAAYRIARTLQQNYTRFIAFVPGYCKSAGTLVLLGAHQLVLSPHAELGPLDVQVSRHDEVGEKSSALGPGAALDVLETRAQRAFFTLFKKLRDMRMATALAAEVASTWSSRFYEEVVGQVDPIRLGEVERANQIGLEYGKRLIAHGRNISEETLVRLLAAYPSHGFVIDDRDARELFREIRKPTDLEANLELREPFSEDDGFWTYLTAEAKEKPADGEAKPNGNAAESGGETPAVDGEAAGGPAEGTSSADAEGRQSATAG
jgi:hypothetical protein